MRPDVSIVVVNYKTFSLTCDCIRAVIDHTKDITYEIVLVDNGSTDEESKAFSLQSPPVVYIRSNENLGFAKGNNLGILRSTGEYILLLNSDTVLLNNAVALARDVFEKDPSVGVVSGQLLYPDGRQQAVAGRFPLLSRVLKDLFRITKSYDRATRARYFLGAEWDYNKPVEADWVWGAFLMFRKDDLRLFPNGKLHDDFFMYFEDVQWCYHFSRVLKKKVLYDPVPKATHFIGQSGSTVTDAEKYFKVILPNEHRWMRKTRGFFYTSFHYFLKGLYYFSLLRPEDIAKGRQFIKYTFR